MVTKSQNKLNYEEVDNRVAAFDEEVDNRVAAFDEWLEGQTEAVRDTVCRHIGALIKAVPTMGEKSAKIVLIEVYLLARRHIHIEKKYGGREK